MKINVRTRTNEYNLDIFRFRKEIGKYWLMKRVVEVVNAKLLKTLNGGYTNLWMERKLYD